MLIYVGVKFKQVATRKMNFMKRTYLHKFSWQVPWEVARKGLYEDCLPNNVHLEYHRRIDVQAYKGSKNKAIRRS